jgi:large subunit ribosomal protein L25
MQQVQLAARMREGTGKGAARTLRRAGQVPAIIYGHGREPLAISVDRAALGKVLEAIGAEVTLLDVAIDGGATVKALIREVQRNPVQRIEVIHLDLYAIVAGEPITVEVPVHIVGIPDGVRNSGGVLDHALHRVILRVLPTDIPEHIDVDVTNLGIGDAIHIRDLVLASGEILNDADVAVVSVITSRAEVAPPEAPAPAEPEVIKKGKADEAETPGA